MINQATVAILRAMNLTAMAEELSKQFAAPSSYKNLGFEERLGLLVDAEFNRRQTKKLAQYIKNAKFSIPGATIEDIEYHADRKLDKGEIQRLATCQYIEDGHHIILKGASGSGKTYISNALGNAACRKFKTVRYIRLPELIDELNASKKCDAFGKTTKLYKNVDLLILDEWLLKVLTLSEAYNLLEIIDARSEKKSIIFCTQYAVEGWYERINSDPDTEDPISDSLLDRIVHNSYEFLIAGDVSMRERHGIKRSLKGDGLHG